MRKGRQIAVLGDLVPDGLLDDRPADHAGRFSESDGETSTFPRALGESGPGKRKPVMNENTLILTEHRVLPRLVDAGLTLLARSVFCSFCTPIC